MYLKQDIVSFTHPNPNIANFYFFYELDTCSRGLSTDFMLGIFL